MENYRTKLSLKVVKSTRFIKLAKIATCQHYACFEQAKAIYELRRKKIRLESIAPLQRLDCFTEEELRRIAPYLSFEIVKP